MDSSDSMKKPWFIWLSLLSFLALFFVMGMKQFYAFITRRGFDMSGWVAFLGRSVGLLVVLVMIPVALLNALISFIFQESSMIWNIALCMLWAYIYFICVFINLRLYRWGKKEEII